MYIRKYLLVIFALFLISEIAYSSDQSPYHFLRIQSSARSAALAGCFVSMTDDPNAVFFNPASVYTINEKKFSATFLKHVLDINSGLVTYSKDIEDFGVVAGSISYTNYGSFQAADPNGNKTGTFGASDIAAMATYSNFIDSNLYYGASLKFIFNNIKNANSFALALDAGILYEFPDDRTKAGLSILHAGSQLSSFENESESLPLDIRMGINHRLRGLPLLVNFSFHHLGDEADNFIAKFESFSIAGELYLGKYIMARIGYDNHIRKYASPASDKKLSGFSGGVGIKANDFLFDYGIALMGTSATLHRFTIGLDI